MEKTEEEGLERSIQDAADMLYKTLMGAVPLMIEQAGTNRISLLAVADILKRFGVRVEEQRHVVVRMANLDA